MPQISERLLRFLTALGRRLEFLATGQTEYHVLTNEFAGIEQVNESLRARMFLEEVQKFLLEIFGIKISKPVLVELVDEGQCNLNSTYFMFSGTLGRYQYQKMGKNNVHLVYILKGLKKQRFKAILAHELSHAYERENGVLKHNKGMREGLARWIEYKMLVKEGEFKEAKKILKIKHWAFGRGIKKFIELEKEMGERQLIEYIKNIES